MKRFLLALFAVAIATVPVAGELVPFGNYETSFGHVHLTVTDLDAHRTFWTEIMGGKMVKNGPLELIEFPGIYIMLRKVDKVEPSAGGVFDHFGFVVRDYPAAEAKWRAHGYKIEPTQNPNESYVFGPDGVKVEVFGDTSLAVPIQFFHFHLYAMQEDIPKMQEWYIQALGGTKGMRPCIACIKRPSWSETTNFAGGNLTFNPSMKTLAPSKGRSIDHAGFEVKNLEAAVKRLEAQGIKLDEPVRQVPNTNTKVAFLTDPWGVRIELTQNLSPAKH